MNDLHGIDICDTQAFLDGDGGFGCHCHYCTCKVLRKKVKEEKKGKEKERTFHNNGRGFLFVNIFLATPRLGPILGSIPKGILHEEKV
jgi:hypothetical protein